MSKVANPPCYGSWSIDPRNILDWVPGRFEEYNFVAVDVPGYTVPDFGGNTGVYCAGTAKEYKSAELNPIEAGCCRPPSECGYPAKNASYYDLNFHPLSSSNDCKVYKNARSVKCCNCDSCKAGVAQYMKTQWRVVAMFNVILFVILSAVYFVACCARRNAATSNSSKVRCK